MILIMLTNCGRLYKLIQFPPHDRDLKGHELNL